MEYTNSKKKYILQRMLYHPDAKTNVMLEQVQHNIQETI